MDGENVTIALGVGLLPTGFIMINSEYSFFTGLLIYGGISLVLYAYFESRKNDN